jgi:hypothetical protein
MRKLFHFFAAGLFIFALYLVVFCSNDSESFILKSPSNSVPSSLLKPENKPQQPAVKEKTETENPLQNKPVVKS